MPIEKDIGNGKIIKRWYISDSYDITLEEVTQTIGLNYLVMSNNNIALKPFQLFDTEEEAISMAKPYIERQLKILDERLDILISREKEIAVLK